MRSGSNGSTDRLYNYKRGSMRGPSPFSGGDGRGSPTPSYATSMADVSSTNGCEDPIGKC